MALAAKRIIILLLPVLLAGGLLAFLQMGRAGDLLFIGGTAAPVESPVSGAAITEWGLNGADVESAKVSFGSSLGNGSRVCVQAADSSGPVANGCHFLAVDWHVGDLPIPIAFGAGIPASYGPGLSSTIPASDLTSVNVTVLGPVITTITGGIPIEIIEIRWVLWGKDTSLVRRVEIDFAPYGINVNSCGNDNICDFEMLFALQDSSGFTLAQLQQDVVLYPCPITSPPCATVGWDLPVPPAAPTVSAEAVTRFVVGVKPGDPWDMMASVPDKVGQGAAMTTDGTYLYLLRGGDGAELYRFEPGVGWTTLPSAPKAPKQGGALTYARDGTGKGYLYALRGGVKADFWRYDIDLNKWSSGPDDPADAPATVRWGGSLAWDGVNGGKIYAFHGSDTKDFWSYSIAGNCWSGRPSCDPALDSAPGMVKDGGALVFIEGDPDVNTDDAVYAMQGGADVGFWKYNVSANDWDSVLQDFTVTIGRGGAITTDGDNLIYALRGNDTKEIWRYQILEDEWAQGPDIPLQMREGGALVFLGGDIYATQGRQQTDFLRISPLPPFAAP